MDNFAAFWPGETAICEKITNINQSELILCTSFWLEIKPKNLCHFGLTWYISFLWLARLKEKVKKHIFCLFTPGFVM